MVTRDTLSCHVYGYTESHQPLLSVSHFAWNLIRVSPNRMVAPQEKPTVNKGPVSGVVPAAGYHLGWVCFPQNTADEFSQSITSEPLGQTCVKQLPWHLKVGFQSGSFTGDFSGRTYQWTVLLFYMKWRRSAVFLM